MKISVERDILLKSLNHIQSVVERRNTIPILSNVKIIANNEGISLTATDLDLEIIESLDKANTIEDGEITTSAHTLYDIVRKLPEGSSLDIANKDNDKLELSCGQSNFELSTLPVEDFPEMSAGEMPCNFIIDSEELANMIDKSKFAISTEETRYYLNGIFFHAINNSLRSVATDGHRLACIQSNLPEGADDIPSIIIPKKTIGEVRKLIEDIEGNINLFISETKIRFEVTNISLTSKLIDGTFPDYEKVIPVSNDKLLQVEAEPFFNAIDRVSTVNQDKTPTVKLQFENNSIKIMATSTDSNKGDEEVAASYAAEALEILFNSKYILDLQDVIEGETMILELLNQSSPVIVKDPKDTTSLYILMPMRI